MLSFAADIYDMVEETLKKLDAGIKLKCVGGGRINHDAQKKAIHVYGYSQVFDNLYKILLMS